MHSNINLEKVSMETKIYGVEECDSDGHQSPSDQLHHSHHLTLAEARSKVRELLGVRALRKERKWPGLDDDTEAYHMLLASQAGSDG